MRLPPHIAGLFLFACSDPAPPNGATSSGGGAGGLGGNAGAAGSGQGGAGGSGGSGGSGPVCADPDLPGMGPKPPDLLSETGLYADIATLTVAANAQPFTPAYPLWSDGAEKTRWIQLPDASLPGCQIDTTDMDHWSFPVGTRIFKEFTLGEVRLETRLIHRHGPGADDFSFATYGWNAAGTEATLLPEGQSDALGTPHDIPEKLACRICHGNLPERVLGFSAIQLSHDLPGLTLDALAATGTLSAPPNRRFSVPGDDIARPALGYLHANCGNCHTPEVSAGFSVFSMHLRVSDLGVEDTDTFQEAVGVLSRFPPSPEVTHRIAPGDPAISAVWFRMASREPFTQMPPFATEIVDDVGLLAVESWIHALSR